MSVKSATSAPVQPLAPKLVKESEQMAKRIGSDVREYFLDHQSQRIFEVASAVLVFIVSVSAGTPLLLLLGVVTSGGLIYHASTITPLDTKKGREELDIKTEFP